MNLFTRVFIYLSINHHASARSFWRRHHPLPRITFEREFPCNIFLILKKTRLERLICTHHSSKPIAVFYNFLYLDGLEQQTLGRKCEISQPQDYGEKKSEKGEKNKSKFTAFVPFQTTMLERGTTKFSKTI